MLSYQSSLLPLAKQLAHLPHLAFFDSAQADGPKNRYDILTCAPRKWWTWQAGKLTGSDEGSFALAELADFLAKEQLPKDSTCNLPFNGGLVGLLRYNNELLDISSKWPDQAATLEIGLYDWAIVTDHKHQTTQLYFHPFCSANTRKLVQNALTTEPCQRTSFKLTSAWQSTWQASDYQAAFKRVKEYLVSGDCYQINLTQAFRALYEGDLLSAYERLRNSVGSPFSGFFATSHHSILSVSPERLLRINENKEVEARPIKGTRPRSASAEQDQANAQALLVSSKDKAENVMIVDLLRNDLGKVAEPGSVAVPTLFGLESYRNVHHMVSVVTAKLAKHVSPLDCLFSASPGGSITGAPKRRAMEIIDELEAQPRSAYCGSLFYYAANGRLDASILIRTMEADGKELTVNGGGGIVYDSNANEEYEESLAKIRKLMQALE
ncbi:aminodeoxychorismate synthase component I [Salinibius halmophilus]|uniref:aminodeoxychorismate synthase component I n=1 Tax=Salinibius halmophilus TaxID=1853216 RepID=UPI001314CF52|nr:aminodeoxychorismate synthase component I [Salinibius halmophilus]